MAREGEMCSDWWDSEDALCSDWRVKPSAVRPGLSGLSCNAFLGRLSALIGWLAVLVSWFGVESADGPRGQAWVADGQTLAQGRAGALGRGSCFHGAPFLLSRGHRRGSKHV